MAKRGIRPIRTDGNVAIIPLTKGYEAVIDVMDVPLVAGYNWRSQVSFRADGEVLSVYAVREAYMDGKKNSVLLHRLIASATPEVKIDHRDGDGLNNRRNNLRAASSSQNLANQRRRVDNSSGVKGVYWYASRGLWHASIAMNGKEHFLGYFAKLEDAAAAYSAASKQLHGEFSRLA